MDISNTSIGYKANWKRWLRHQTLKDVRDSRWGKWWKLVAKVGDKFDAWNMVMIRLGSLPINPRDGEMWELRWPIADEYAPDDVLKAALLDMLYAAKNRGWEWTSIRWNEVRFRYKAPSAEHRPVDVGP